MLTVHAGTRGPGTPALMHDREIELDAGRVDRVVEAIVDRHLGRAAGRKRRHGLDRPLLAGVADAAHGDHDVGRDRRRRGDEPVGMLLHRAVGDLVADVHQSPARLRSGPSRRSPPRSGRPFGQVAGHLAEHVLGRHRASLRLGVLQRTRRRTGSCRSSPLREAEHQVDDADVAGKRHGRQSRPIGGQR